ncbi:MAG: transporter [Pontiella sp.]
MNRLMVFTLTVLAANAGAQALEPRFYSNAPVGMNFALGGYALSSGGLSADSSVNLTDANVDLHLAFAAYARSGSLFGKSAKFDVVVPYGYLYGSGFLDGTFAEREVDGFADPQFRLSVNLVGAPALTLAEFKDYKQNFVMGTSLKVTAPMGQYDSNRALNIGTHRWSVAPEIGMSKTFGSLVLELAGAATVYTDNNNFLGQKKEQDPLYSVQGHVVYTFKRGIWLALDATRYAGGRTTVGGVEKNDFQQNTRLGATLAVPVSKQNSIKLYASSGVSARTGTNFDTYGAAWQYRWGGGL